MTVAAVNLQAGTGPAPAKAAGAQAAKPPPPAAPSRRRGMTPLTPMRQKTAKLMRNLAAQVQESHPELTVHDHLRDAAGTLESGNEEGAQRHLRAAIGKLTPQSLMRNGMHTDELHIAARQVMDGAHRHLLLVKDITDVAARNQEAVRRDSGDGAAVPPPRPDPNAGYGPGANAQKPAIRQPPGDQAMNAPAKADGGGSDPSVADPGGAQVKGPKHLSYGWGELARVVEFTGCSNVVDLVGPRGYEHNWVFIGIPGSGQKVTFGTGKHATGTVEHADATHVHVRMGDGSVVRVPHDGKAGPGKLAPASLAAHGGPEAAAARKAASSVRLEPGLTRGQKEEAEQRLYRAAGHLDAGNHGEAAAELDAAMHATSLRGGGVIKGSTAAQARDLRDKARGKGLSTPGLTADGLNMTGAAGGRRAQKAALAQASLADLKAVDAENAHRAALLGKPGQVSATHQLVKDEIASRTAKGATVQTAYDWRDLENFIELSARTAQLESTPAPYGKPGGPGLYGVAGNKHSDYFEQVVKGLMAKRGMDKGKASQVAWGVLRKWAHGGGGVHPEVQAAAAKALAQEAAASAKAHAHAVSWDQVSRDIELATVLEFFNPAQPRLPVGPGGGQFAGGGAQPAGGQQPAGKAPAKAQPKPTAAQLHALHVAHVAHVNGVSTAKAGFMVAAADDRAKASALIKQRDALAKALASASGKVSTGQAGAKTAKTAATKTTAPATAKAKAAAKPAAASTTAAKPKTAKTAAKTAAKAPAAAVKAGSAAAMKMQIASLNTQIAGLLAQAAQATAQAAKIR